MSEKDATNPETMSQEIKEKVLKKILSPTKDITSYDLDNAIDLTIQEYRKRVEDAIDKKLSCSLYNLPIGKQCDDEDCQNCTKNKELKKEILK